MTMQASGTSGTTPALVGVEPAPATELPAKKKNGAPHAHAQPQIPKPIVDAIRAEMKALIEADDLDANLILLEQLAGRARELFMTFKAPHARFTRRGLGMYSGDSYAYGGGSTFYTGGIYPTSTQAIGAPEQFGAKAIREIISILPELLAGRSESASPDKLVDAIAAAKKNGEEEIAKELTARLLAKPENITEKITNRLKALLPKDAPGEGIVPAEDGDDLEDGVVITVGAESADSNGAPQPTNGASAS